VRPKNAPAPRKIVSSRPIRYSPSRAKYCTPEGYPGPWVACCKSMCECLRMLWTLAVPSTSLLRALTCPLGWNLEFQKGIMIKRGNYAPLVLIPVLAGFISGLLWSTPFFGRQLPNPSWVFTGNLNTARESHTATLLSNGEVLVAGGFGTGVGDCDLINSAELYDPAIGAWRFTGSLNNAR
jgi:hypothetical protein